MGTRGDKHLEYGLNKTKLKTALVREQEWK